MELRDYIEKALQAPMTGRELASHLGIGANELTDAKGGRRGLPNHACVKLAKLIKEEPLEIIAASELATEKRPEKQEFWRRILEAPASTTASTAGTVSYHI
jgi:hypothetical protein